MPVQSLSGDGALGDHILGPCVQGSGVWNVAAWTHVAGVCQQVLDDEDIDAIDWLLRPPALTPFTYLWDITASTAAYEVTDVLSSRRRSPRRPSIISSTACLRGGGERIQAH